MSLRAWSRIFPAAFALGFGAWVVCVPEATAEPVVDLQWNDVMCRTTGPLDQTITAGGFETALATRVIGQTDPQQAYELRFRIRRPDGGALPDAWRFDAAGCAAGMLMMTVSNAIPESCPRLSGVVAARTTQSVEYDEPAVSERLQYTRSYPPSGPIPYPQARYILVWLVLDLLDAVPGPGDPPSTCWGLEQAVCFQLESATWTDLAGVVHPWTIATPFASVNAASLGGVAACSATPAHAATWGAIKQQYR